MLLESAALAPATKVSELQLATDADLHQVLVGFNNTIATLPPPYKSSTMHGLFHHWAVHNPGATAVTFQVGCIAWCCKVGSSETSFCKICNMRRTRH